MDHCHLSVDECALGVFFGTMLFIALLYFGTVLWCAFDRKPTKKDRP